MMSQRTKTSRRKWKRHAEERALWRAHLDHTGCKVVGPEPFTINLIPVILPDGETVYTSPRKPLWSSGPPCWMRRFVQ